MQQNARFIRKLPIPMDIKKEFPITEQITDCLLYTSRCV